MKKILTCEEVKEFLAEQMALLPETERGLELAEEWRALVAVTVVD